MGTRRFITLLLTAAMGLVLASCNLGLIADDTSAPSVVISSPTGEQTILVGEEINIISTSFSDLGIARVELVVNGEIAQTYIPQNTNEKTYVVNQSWMAATPGSFYLLVMVEDMKGQSAQSTIVTVNVVEQTGQQPPAPSATDPPTQQPEATAQPSQETPAPPQQTPEETLQFQFAVTLALPPLELFLPTATPTSSSFTPLLPPIQVFPLYPPEVYFRTDEIQLGSGQTGSISASCNSGDILTSGGYVLSTENMYLLKSYAKNNTWEVKATNTAGKTRTVKVVAVCLKNSGGTLDIVKKAEYVPPDVEHEITASCPAGSVLVGGGWATENDNLFVRQSAPLGNAWAIRVAHNSNADKKTTAYALCLSGTSATATQHMEYVYIGADKTKEVTAFCPPGELLGGGGFFQEIRSRSNDPVYVSTEEISYGWHLKAHNPAHHTTFSVYSYVICLNFP
jgi:hypothetical protein